MDPLQEKRVVVQLDQVTAERINEPELVSSLVRVVECVCGGRTGGSDALAQLLMSCYDGSEYQLDVTELCRLDDEFFEDSLNLIRLRCRASHEPHTFFVDGGRLFNQIAADYGIRPKSTFTEEDLLS